MAASTVSISANTSTASRRRPVLSTENTKRTHIDVTTDVTNPPINHTTATTTLDRRSTEFVQIKKPSDPNSAVPPRRTRKPTSPPKSRWQTLLSVVSKNLVLLACLAGLIQVVRRAVVGFGGDGSVSLMGFSDMEGRIADVESYVKTTSKMLQVQLEVVEKKMEGGFSDLRSEVDGRLDKRNAEIESRLNALSEKSEILEKGLGQLRSKELLSKEDFGRLYEEMKKSKVGDLGESELSLDEIGELAKRVVGDAIEKHAADGLGMVDYALATGGAVVVRHSEPFSVGKGGNWFAMGGRLGVHGDAEKVLRPSFGEPGQCFPLKGSSGFVEIRLRAAVVPEAVTLEHVAKSVAYDRSSAPKDCRVYGWLERQRGAPSVDNNESSDAVENTLLTEFTYDLDKSNAQTFNVLDSASSAVVDTIRFDYTSNHGSHSHTCIYRVRVHGQEASALLHLDATH